MLSTAQSSYRYDYEISPIILINGIASNMSNNGTLPIVALTENNYIFKPTNPSNIQQIQPSIPGDYWAHFIPMAGGTLHQFQVAEYPFASLSVAANAMIQMPLNITILMVVPANSSVTMDIRKSRLTALKNALDNHILSGGTFNVNTPAYMYENCLLTSSIDISGMENEQKQWQYQLNFTQPLITQAQADKTLIQYNNTMNKIANGLPIQGQPKYSNYNIGNTQTNTP